MVKDNYIIPEILEVIDGLREVSDHLLYGPGYELIPKLKAAEYKILDLWEEIADNVRRLEAGNLHQGHCNADHRGPVGNAGCSCRLGRIIKDLRIRVENAEAELNEYRARGY